MDELGEWARQKAIEDALIALRARVTALQKWISELEVQATKLDEQLTAEVVVSCELRARVVELEGVLRPIVASLDNVSGRTLWVTWPGSLMRRTALEALREGE